jgi:hypothetical protein
MYELETEHKRAVPTTGDEGPRDRLGSPVRHHGTDDDASETKAIRAST